MADDKQFFGGDAQEDTQQAEQPEEQAPEKVKVGDQEYSQDELAELVGLGQMGRDLEKKFNTSFDKLMPEYTKTTQELAEIKKQQEEAQKRSTNEQIQNQGYQSLPQEEIDRIAREELARLGYPTKEELVSEVSAQYQALRYLEDIGQFIDGQVGEGKPDVTEEELLSYMQRKGMNEDQYKEAYKEMFPGQIKAWEDEHLQSQRPSGMVTDTTSTAGAKLPEQVKITRKNLGDAIDAALEGKI